MKYCIFTPAEPSFLDVEALLCTLEGSINLFNEGHNITLFDCDGNIPEGCCYNRKHDPWVCRNCKIYKRSLFSMLPKEIQVVSASKYVKDIALSPQFKYNNIEDIKKCEYKNVEVGYCCLSAYIFQSRNLYPLIDEEFRAFIDTQMKRSCQYTDIIEAVIKEYQPDALGCFNDRYVYCRPVVNIAQRDHLNYICFEWWHMVNGEPSVMTFTNVECHNLSNRLKIIHELWESPDIPIGEKKKIAENFYYKRRNSIYSGDKIYVKEQKSGTMPNEWDSTKHNIVILNSSEDEMASLGKEYEKDKDFNLFPTQIQGLQYIAEKYKGLSNIHFYLRIHPNLKNVPYLYHRKLQEIGFDLDNFTVIPGNSEISTYSLIDAADKVVVFGSTTGAEAAYYGKPVILLANATYRPLGFCYCPSNTDELDKLILDFSLAPIHNDGPLQYAYYSMNDHFPEYKVFHHQIKRIKFNKRNFEIFNFDKVGWFQNKFLVLIQMLGKWHLFPAYHEYPRKEDKNTAL